MTGKEEGEREREREREREEEEKEAKEKKKLVNVLRINLFSLLMLCLVITR